MGIFGSSVKVTGSKNQSTVPAADVRHDIHAGGRGYPQRCWKLGLASRQASWWTTDYPNAQALIKEAREYTKLANELHLMVITPQSNGDEDRPQRDAKAGRYEDDRRRQPQPAGGRNPGEDDDIPF